MSMESTPASSDVKVPPGERPPARVAALLDTLARIPLSVVVGALVLGAVLLSLQMVWISIIMASGEPEPPQWLARLTVMQANILVPVALIALWARRRKAQRRLGAIAAAMMAVLPVLHVILTVGSIMWGAILGRGDMTYPFMYIEYLMFITMLGIILSGVAWILDSGAPRLIGPLIIAGFVLNYVVSWGMTFFYVALSVVILRTQLVRSRAAVEPLPSIS